MDGSLRAEFTALLMQSAGNTHVQQTLYVRSLKPFDAHCCHTGTVVKHPVPDRVKPSFVSFDIRAL